VTWNYERTIPVRLTIDKANFLQECQIHLEVVQDYSNGGRGEKITLGYVTLNLAEYVEESEGLGHDGEEGITRRYLMQESKINSTLKLGIMMKQIDGDRSFIAPPLKTAPVFGGIAGIMAGEQGEQDDLGHMPSISKSRDASDLQDMYRRALAASWAAQPGEMAADKCIEDIFAGGDGWKDKHAGHPSPPRGVVDDSASGEEQHLHRPHHHHRTQSGASLKSQSTITGKNAASRINHRHNKSTDNLGRSPASATTQNDTSSENSERGRTGLKRAHEVDEFEVRDDLMAWKLPGTLSARIIT